MSNLDLESNYRFIQFELWKDCNNNCKFCFNKGQPDFDKIESLNFVIQKVQEPIVDRYNEIGFIGGEFFDTQIDNEDVKKLFYKLFDIIIQKIYDKKIVKLYITSSLILDMNKHLIPFLNYLQDKNVLEKVLLCTSYDLKYRFHTEERKKLWEDNMILLHQMYPNLRLHTETIVTGFFVDAVNNGEFSITDFCNKFHTRVDYIEPGSGFYYYDKKACAKDMPDFFPKKENFIQFLMKTAIENKEIDLDTFISADIRSDVIYCNYDGKRTCMSGRRKTNAVITIKDLKVKYELGMIDSDIRMTEIVKQFREMYGN